MDFHTSSTVIGRKPHRCAHCGTDIQPGEKHRKAAQVWEGQFDAYREHENCYAAWNRLNFASDMRDLPGSEGAPFLRDDEHDERDREWMREQYPLVAQRLGWVSP